MCFLSGWSNDYQLKCPFDRSVFPQKIAKCKHVKLVQSNWSQKVVNCIKKPTTISIFKLCQTLQHAEEYNQGTPLFLLTPFYEICAATFF